MNIMEDLRDPKKKAIIQLIFYAIFFVFVFIIIGTKTKDNSSNTDNTQNNGNSADINQVVEDAKNTNEYEYTFYIDNVEIKGNIVDDDNTFIIDGETYIKTDGITYNSNTMEIVTEFDFDKYLYSNIENLIEKSEFIEKTTFKDQSEKVTYLVTDENYCIECNMIIEKDQYIKKVIIGDSVELNFNVI